MSGNDEQSLNDEATFAGARGRVASEVSLGDERTLGDEASGQETTLDDLEIVDLEARYRVEGTLGQGGMGAVLLATDARLGRKVAIKRILGEAAVNRMAVSRFLTEAKAIAALNHPNIVQIYDSGRAKDGPFLIMEYVDGGSLLDRCLVGALPLDEAIDLACHLCDGLAKAHDAGIVHRDIKPANVLLTKDGTPKLADFGLAKAESGDHGQTVTGAILGTPDFMPLEQRRHTTEVDARSDLWSLAATIYQMVTGRSPKVIRLHELPPSLQSVLARALEDRKESRFQTARELRDALRSGMRSVPAQAGVVTGEGICPSCGVQNDPSRKFCRGCGGTLEAPCLACQSPMPLWEEFCGFCGAKQTPLVEQRRADAVRLQAEAEGLLGDLDFDGAAKIALSLRDDSHARVGCPGEWIESFLARVEEVRHQQTERALVSLREAREHESAFDYSSAVAAYQSIPLSFHSMVIPGTRETIAQSLERTQRIQSEVKRLQHRIQERISRKRVDELLPDVERLLALQPTRTDVGTLRGQLVARIEERNQSRDASLARAKVCFDSHDYNGAVAALSSIPLEAATKEVESLKRRASAMRDSLEKEAAALRKAFANNKLGGLLYRIEEYLKRNPADDEIAAMRAQYAEAVARKNRMHDEAWMTAQKRIGDCDFEGAIAGLEEALQSDRSEDLEELLRTTKFSEQRRQYLAKFIRNAVAKKQVEKLLPVVDEYLQLRPYDIECVGLRQRLAMREKRRQAVLVLGGVIAAILCFIAWSYTDDKAREEIKLVVVIVIMAIFGTLSLFLIARLLFDGRR